MGGWLAKRGGMWKPQVACCWGLDKTQGRCAGGNKAWEEPTKHPSEASKVPCSGGKPAWLAQTGVLAKKGGSHLARQRAALSLSEAQQGGTLCL